MMDVHFEDAQNGWILDHFNTYRTTDGGASWFEKHGPFGMSPIYQEDTHFFDASHRLVITLLEGAEIWQTLDDGVSWSPLYQRFGTGGYADIDELDDGSLVVCSSFGDLMRSTDQGQTWLNFTHCPEDLDRSNVEAIGSSPGGLAFAGGRDFLWLRSADHGRTWHIPPASPGFRTARSIVFRDDLLALAGGYLPGEPSRVSRTTDGGQTWTPYFLTGSYVGYPDEIVFTSSSICYLTTLGETGNNRVFRSTDTGETWTERTTGLPSDVELHSISFLDTEIGFV